MIQCKYNVGTGILVFNGNCSLKSMAQINFDLINCFKT